MHRPYASICAIALSGATFAQNVPDWIALDGFEFATPPTSFRFIDLDLRDPHVYLPIVLPPPLPTICSDFTDNALPGAGFSFNGAIQQSFGTDADPADGLLDASSLLWFRPLRQDGALARVDGGSADCVAPAPPISCAPTAGGVPRVAQYAAFSMGTCLAPRAGTLGAPPYSPAVTSSAAVGTEACFTTAPREALFEFDGVLVPLIDAQVAARFVGQPANALADGLLSGFLRETDANQILIANPSLPGGSATLASLLAGGSGNCSARNDKDSHRGESGWWFYFNFNATTVNFTGP
ncbi:MAG: hypothetical protein DYH17_09000 [Xanthomonadales bacterium PRO6]|nr:hypothetical protein [Xanthomonadales bacterium PRO6]